jgi:Nucleotidyl transferase AbiEii toxin, Type IV TA system
VNKVERAFRELEVDLRQLNLRWALIGGLAVSLRAEPRTTQDLDVSVAVEGDREADSVVLNLRSLGYGLLPDGVFKRQDRDRIALVRLVANTDATRGVIVDLMFAASGIEQEVVANAELLETPLGIAVPVATTAHLLALKALAGRAKDVTDFASLMRVASERDIQQAREALDLISRRGYDGGKDLQSEFERLLELAPGQV